MPLERLSQMEHLSALLLGWPVREEEAFDFDHAWDWLGQRVIEERPEEFLLSEPQHESVVQAALPPVGLLVAIDVVERTAQVSQRNCLGLLDLEKQLPDLELVQLRANLFHHHLHIGSGGVCHGDSGELLSQVGRQWFFARVVGGVHAGDDAEMGVAREVGEVALLVEHEALALDERDDLLKDVVGGQVDLVNEDPVAVAQRTHQVALQETEHQFAVHAVQVPQDVRELTQHLLPLSPPLAHLLHDARDGLHQALEQQLGLALQVVVVEIGQVGLVLLSPRHLRSELLQEAVEEIPEQDARIDGLEAADQVVDVSAAGHVVDEEAVAGQLGQVLHERGLAAARLAHQQRVLPQLEAHRQLLQHLQRVLRLHDPHHALRSARDLGSTDRDRPVTLLEGNHPLPCACACQVAHLQLNGVHEVLSEETPPQPCVSLLLWLLLAHLDDAAPQPVDTLPQLGESEVAQLGVLLQQTQQECAVLLVMDGRQDVLDGLGGQYEVRNQSGNAQPALGVAISLHDAQDAESSVGSDGALVEREGSGVSERLEADQQFVGDLREVVEDQEDALLHGVEEWPADVLELPELLLAHEVAQQRVQLHRPVHPQLHPLPAQPSRQVVGSHQASLRQPHLHTVKTALLTLCFSFSLVHIIPHTLSEGEQVVGELSHPHRVLLPNLCDLLLEFTVVVAVEQARKRIYPQSLLVRPTRHCWKASETQDVEVESGNQACDVQDFEEEGEIGVHLPERATAHDGLHGQLRLLVEDWVRESDKRRRPERMGAGEWGLGLRECPESREEAVGMGEQELGCVEAVERGGLVARVLLRLTFNSLHSAVVERLIIICQYSISTNEDGPAMDQPLQQQQQYSMINQQERHGLADSLLRHECDLYEDLSTLMQVFRKLLQAGDETSAKAAEGAGNGEEARGRLRGLARSLELLGRKYSAQSGQLRIESRTFQRFLCRLFETLEICQLRQRDAPHLAAVETALRDSCTHDVQPDARDNNSLLHFLRLVASLKSLVERLAAEGSAKAETVLAPLSRKPILLERMETRMIRLSHARARGAAEAEAEGEGEGEEREDSEEEEVRSVVLGGRKGGSLPIAQSIGNELQRRFELYRCLDVDFGNFKSSYFSAKSNTQQFYRDYLDRNALTSRLIAHYRDDFSLFQKKRTKHRRPHQHRQEASLPSQTHEPANQQSTPKREKSEKKAKVVVHSDCLDEEQREQLKTSYKMNSIYLTFGKKPPKPRNDRRCPNITPAALKASQHERRPNYSFCPPADLALTQSVDFQSPLNLLSAIKATHRFKTSPDRGEKVQKEAGKREVGLERRRRYLQVDCTSSKEISLNKVILTGHVQVRQLKARPTDKGISILF